MSCTASCRSEHHNQISLDDYRHAQHILTLIAYIRMHEDQRWQPCLQVQPLLCQCVYPVSYSTCSVHHDESKWRQAQKTARTAVSRHHLSCLGTSKVSRCTCRRFEESYRYQNPHTSTNYAHG